MKSFKAKILFITALFFIMPGSVLADEAFFRVDPSYDASGRTRVEAFPLKIGDKAYFYIESNYYYDLDADAKKEITDDIRELSDEFDNVIYPQLTSLYGSEWKPGIDGDEKVTILLTDIKGDMGGYFNPSDEYPRAQAPSSNEREMVYFNVNYIGSGLAKGYLAHEFVHLITFNQKTQIFGVIEETWMNELRADVAPTLLGYDDVYEGSYLQKRVRSFVQDPGDSLTEWRNSNADYGALNLFAQYVMDHYGKNIIIDSMRTEEVGINSVRDALLKNDYSESFKDIFLDWLIASLINDCSAGEKYCYLNPGLSRVKILPEMNYLPSSAESTLSVTDYIKDWAGKWIKFIGGEGNLEIEFVEKAGDFKVFYVLQNKAGGYSVEELVLDKERRGNIWISGFTDTYSSLILVPFSSEKKSGFKGLETYRQFIWSASVEGNSSSEDSSEEDPELINQLLAQIDYLTRAIAELKAKIAALSGNDSAEEFVCGSRFTEDLYYGIEGKKEVRCLQQFLKDQGEDIYPEGIVSGGFFDLTEEAVIRFQNKYASEILTPVGLDQATGYVGPSTRAKINELIGQ